MSLVNSDISDTSENKNSTKIFTVEQLNMQIRSLIEGQMGTVWIQAEISNFKPHTSGHSWS
jgi:exodeoxyribonuclease VII large subunit